MLSVKTIIHTYYWCIKKSIGIWNALLKHSFTYLKSSNSRVRENTEDRILNLKYKYPLFLKINKILRRNYEVIFPKWLIKMNLLYYKTFSWNFRSLNLLEFFCFCSWTYHNVIMMICRKYVLVENRDHLILFKLFIKKSLMTLRFRM